MDTALSGPPLPHTGAEAQARQARRAQHEASLRSRRCRGFPGERRRHSPGSPPDWVPPARATASLAPALPQAPGRWNQPGDWNPGSATSLDSAELSRGRTQTSVAAATTDTFCSPRPRNRVWGLLPLPLVWLENQMRMPRGWGVGCHGGGGAGGTMGREGSRVGVSAPCRPSRAPSPPRHGGPASACWWPPLPHRPSHAGPASSRHGSCSSLVAGSPPSHARETRWDCAPHLSPCGLSRGRPQALSPIRASSLQ